LHGVRGEASYINNVVEQHSGQKEMFSYEVDTDRRMRADHPLRAIRATIDFGFVRQEVARCCGYNGQVSVDPEVILCHRKPGGILMDIQRDMFIQRLHVLVSALGCFGCCSHSSHSLAALPFTW
jgi:hypothetical protein